MDDATSRARAHAAIEHDLRAIWGCQTPGSTAERVLDSITANGFQIIDTRTHAAIPREPSEEVVERVARAIFDDDWCARDRHGTNAIARAAIAALCQSAATSM